MEAPKCPSCGKALDKVWENMDITYKWLPEKGFYTEDTDSGSLENQCPNCEADLSEVFPDGVCNYFRGKDEPKAKLD